MSTDYAEKERDFIASLNEDTGRDLAGWMSAIAESGLRERNEIIDWLRHQGFQFARASWIERIHHNGGRLIYAGSSGQSQQRARFSSAPREIEDEPPPAAAADRRATAPPEQAPPDGDVQRLLAEAKGLRPLAELILREIAALVPGVALNSANAAIVISAPHPFAALVPGPRRLRLFANFGQAGTARIQAAEPVNRAAAPFAGMMLLDDARSVDDEFRRLIRAAAPRH